MHEQALEELGLTRNEARIYVTLLSEGECGVGRIAMKSGVHRRNVYDSLRRLVEEGLVYESLSKKERVYQAAPPETLSDILEQRRLGLSRMMPALEALYRGGSERQQVCIYRGAEGWKNYMRDMLRNSTEAHFIAAKGGWLDQRVQHFFPYFDAEAKKRNMRFFHLFDHEVKDQFPQVLPHVGTDYKFLPKGFSTNSAIDIFDDQVTLIPDMKLGALGDEIRLVVIVDRAVADTFRSWFQLMWAICP